MTKNQKIKNQKNSPPLHYLLYNLTLPHLMCQPSLSESHSKALDYLSSIGTGDVETQNCLIVRVDNYLSHTADLVRQREGVCESVCGRDRERETQIECVRVRERDRQRGMERDKVCACVREIDTNRDRRKRGARMYLPKVVSQSVTIREAGRWKRNNLLCLNKKNYSRKWKSK